MALIGSMSIHTTYDTSGKNLLAISHDSNQAKLMIAPNRSRRARSIPHLTESNRLDR